VVTNENNVPVVVKTRFPLSRAIVPSLVRCFPESEGQGFKRAVKLAADTAANRIEQQTAAKRSRDEALPSDDGEQQDTVRRRASVLRPALLGFHCD
jgi:hypothetical protein